MGYTYPAYAIELTPQILQECCDVALKLLHAVGFRVAHEQFLSQIRGMPGIRIDGDRVYFDPDLAGRYLQEFISGECAAAQAKALRPKRAEEWRVVVGGVAMNLIDMETEEIRPATCQDLRDGIKLVNSYGIGGNYPVMPQDLPPIMRAIACFKICYETSQDIRPYDYQQPEQTRYIYEMNRVMGKPFTITLCVPTQMTLDPKDVDVFLSFHADFKKNRDITFATVDHPMGGITKPITIPGCATMTLAESLAVHILFNLFDPEVRTPVYIRGPSPTDMRHACWAFGAPNRHLYSCLNAQLVPRLCGQEPPSWAQDMVLLETASAVMDEQAALEKMAQGLLGALQGARSFYYAGSLCVDDLFSGVQFVMDVEMVKYIRQVIEAFDPHPDIISTEGLYEECREVSLGRDTFLSHENTVKRFRNIVSPSERLIRQKLQSWLSHRTTLKDRARAEALDRIRNFEPYHLPEDRQSELDKIYARAQKELIGR